MRYLHPDTEKELAWYDQTSGNCGARSSNLIKILRQELDARFSQMETSDQELTLLKASLEWQLSAYNAALTDARLALRKIRDSSGEQVMVCTAEGHSFCVHTANAALANNH
jgi:hypothetical protein